MEQKTPPPRKPRRLRQIIFWFFVAALVIFGTYGAFTSWDNFVLAVFGLFGPPTFILWIFGYHRG